MNLHSPVPSQEIECEVERSASAAARSAARAVIAIAATLVVLAYAGVFDLERFRDAAPTIAGFFSEASPPDFTRWREWVRPLIDTLAMSACGTALAAAISLTLAPLAARNMSPAWLRTPLRFAFAILRSIPAVVWGVVFVAAVGFGPLPGALALAVNSTGMLGKLYFELLEHVEPSPGLALRSLGVSKLGILRFAMLPQVLPRLVDATFDRFEQNVHNATVMGLIGAGGIGLEIITAFHLFEYRAALALIIVVLLLVVVVNAIGAALRAYLLDSDELWSGAKSWGFASATEAAGMVRAEWSATRALARAVLRRARVTGYLAALSIAQSLADSEAVRDRLEELGAGAADRAQVMPLGDAAGAPNPITLRLVASAREALNRARRLGGDATQFLWSLARRGVDTIVALIPKAVLEGLRAQLRNSRVVAVLALFPRALAHDARRLGLVSGGGDESVFAKAQKEFAASRVGCLLAAAWAQVRLVWDPGAKDSVITDGVAGSDVENSSRSASPLSGRREALRRVFLKVHRTIGLFLGAVIVLVGLSGSILAYRQAIDERLNADLMLVDIPAQGAFRPLDEILAAAKAVIPPDGVPERLRMPRHRGASAAVTYVVEADDLQTTFYEIFIDPYTAKVKGQRIYLQGDGQLAQPFIRILIAFHWTLLLGFNNAYILGTIGIFVFLSILIGLYLWWPANGNWRQGLRIKWGASPERIAFDVHRSVGVFSAAILLVMLFTGVAMIFKPTTRSAVTLFSPVRLDPEFGRSKPIPDRSPIGVGEAVAIADKVFPDGKLRWILLPSKPTSAFVVGKMADNEPNRTQTYRNVGIDQYSGQVLHVQDRDNFTSGERFIEWLFPLHSGEAFGEPGRPFILLIGLIPLTLYVSGFLRWRQRRRARRLLARSSAACTESQ